MTTCSWNPWEHSRNTVKPHWAMSIWSVFKVWFLKKQTSPTSSVHMLEGLDQVCSFLGAPLLSWKPPYCLPNARPSQVPPTGPEPAPQQTAPHLHFIWVPKGLGPTISLFHSAFNSSEMPHKNPLRKVSEGKEWSNFSTPSTGPWIK